MSSSPTIDHNSSISDSDDNTNKKKSERQYSRSRSSSNSLSSDSELENHSGSQSHERKSKGNKGHEYKLQNKKHQSLSPSTSDSILEIKSTNKNNKISSIIDTDTEEEVQDKKKLETTKKGNDLLKNENKIDGKQTTIDSDNDIEILNNSTKTLNDVYVPTNKRLGRKNDSMVEKDCQIEAKDNDNLKSDQNNQEKPVLYNLDVVLNFDIDELTLAEIENKLTEINNFIKMLNKKKSILLSKKSIKLAHKKKIQKAVENKSSLEFGLFDECLTITKKGTLRMDKQNKVDNDIEILDTVDENTKPHSTDVVIDLPKDKQKDNRRDKHKKKEVTSVKRKNDFHELFKHKYSKHNNKRLIPSDESTSDEDNRNNSNEVVPKKRRRILSNKYSKKTNKKGFKSIEVIEAVSDSDDTEDAIRTRSSNLYKKYREKFKEFFEPKCLVKIFSHDLIEMKNQIINQQKNQTTNEAIDNMKNTKSIEHSKNIVVNEEVLSYIEIRSDNSDNDFEVLSIPDGNCNQNNSSEENDLLSAYDKKNDNDDQSSVVDNRGETSDILKILDKKHEVVTEFIK